MDGTSERVDREKCLDDCTHDTAVTTLRDRAEIDPRGANERVLNGGHNTTQMCDLQIEVSSRNSEICDTNGSIDHGHESLDYRKCTCTEDTALFSRPASDLKNAGYVIIVEDECRICQSRGDEVLISPCKCSGSTKWIHESCLVKWFQISQTSSCELCSRFVAIKKRTRPLQKVSE